MPFLQKLKALLHKETKPGEDPLQPAEKAGLLETLHKVLHAQGRKVVPDGPYLRLENGLMLQTHWLQTVMLDENKCRTVTTITVWHPTLFADSLFEYQHATAATEEESLAAGFLIWAQMDLLVLEDALLEKPKSCKTKSLAAGKREVLLGPHGHLSTQPYQAKKEKHPFCECCLFAQTEQALLPLIADGKVHGIRLFAARDAQGNVSAECRVDGLDYAPALPALQEYVQSWPQHGLEFRKQYILLRSTK